MQKVSWKMGNRLEASLSADAALAAAIAETAGKLLLALQKSELLPARELGAAGDAVSQRFIAAALQANRPDDGVISEEGVRRAGPAFGRRIWIVDPLDGTREFSERRTDWAVHVALSIEGSAEIGAVALPALGITMSTASPQGASMHRAGKRVRMVVSRTRAPALAENLARALDAEIVQMGSAGAKAMAVVRGEADIYLHAGGQYEWDSCAPVAVARAAGLHASRIDGSECVYGGADSYMPDLLICRPDLAERVCAHTQKFMKLEPQGLAEND